jgi:hypothetical protein
MPSLVARISLGCLVMFALGSPTSARAQERVDATPLPPIPVYESVIAESLLPPIESPQCGQPFGVLSPSPGVRKPSSRFTRRL